MPRIRVCIPRFIVNGMPLPGVLIIMGSEKEIVECSVENVYGDMPRFVSPTDSSVEIVNASSAKIADVAFNTSHSEALRSINLLVDSPCGSTGVAAIQLTALPGVARLVGLLGEDVDIRTLSRIYAEVFMDGELIGVLAGRIVDAFKEVAGRLKGMAINSLLAKLCKGITFNGFYVVDGEATCLSSLTFVTTGGTPRWERLNIEEGRVRIGGSSRGVYIAVYDSVCNTGVGEEAMRLYRLLEVINRG